MTEFFIASFNGKRADLIQFIAYPEIELKVLKKVNMQWKV